MAKRSFDFNTKEKADIRESYGYTCAACGFDFPGHLEADHWTPGNAKDDGVCLCSFCNRVKGNVKIPEYLRLPPRLAVEESNRHAFQEKVWANRTEWMDYVSKFRGALPKYINSRKWPQFVTPY